MTYYSGGSVACVCCGESEMLFLSLDHIHGGGNEDRKVRGSGVKLYTKLRKAGYPGGFQVLCFNCNMAKGSFGTCPHKEDRVGSSHR